MILRPPRSTRTDTLFPYTTLFRSTVVLQGFFDLAQVEVMKGPQALFFGKNSTAGVISLTSANPTDELEGYLRAGRSEEHTSELQSLMRISYAVFCLTKTK